MDLTKKCVLNEKMAKFAAEAMKAALFDYSFDSDKVPTLNLNYFCDDYLNTQKMVDEKIMEEGNMGPLCEELENVISSSVWVPSNVSNAIFAFRTRLKHGEYEKINDRKPDIENGYKGKLDYYRHSVEYLTSIFESDEPYIFLLLDQIELLLTAEFSNENCKMMLFCIREFLSELINKCVSKQYLFYSVNKNLFENKKSDEPDNNYLMDFLIGLLPEESEYEVVFGISQDVHKVFRKITKFTRDAKENEQDLLKTSYVCHFSNEIAPIEAVDPVSALELAKTVFSDYLAAYNLGLHAETFSAKENGLVKKVSESKFNLINDSSNTLCRTITRRAKENEIIVELMFKDKFDRKVEELFTLHNSALLTKNHKSQLLNLWTIIEVAIDSKQSFSCRISYITDILCPILSIVYYKRLTERLFRVVVNNIRARRVLASLYPEKDALESFALCVKNKKEEIKSFFNDNLFLEYHFDFLSDLFSSRKKLYNDWQRHIKRLRWQLSRIYRSRCQIIHDGHEPSYLESLVENLHYYVDEMFDFIIYNTQKGLHSLNAILSAARIKEYEIESYLSDKERSDTISDEEFLNIFITR